MNLAKSFSGLSSHHKDSLMSTFSAISAAEAALTFPTGLSWQGDPHSLAFEDKAIREVLSDLNRPVWVVPFGGRLGVTCSGSLVSTGSAEGLAAFAPAISPTTLGDPAFRAAYNTRYAYYAGSMANAISSAGFVIALGQQGLLGSYGAGGMSPARIEEAIRQVQAALPNGPYAFNLINSPNELAMEQRAAALYLQYGVKTIEASAYLALTSALVWYRAAGLQLAPDGQILINNRIIAKVSRKEVSKRFLEPAPADILAQLVSEGKITSQQANLAARVPMADDITMEADSGGHTDNRPLVSILPAIIAQRDEIQAKYNYPYLVRIGAGGGIATPSSALAAFMMGAAYVVTGSINQGCIEAGASQHTRTLLSQAEMTDVAMAPAGDMFEMGVKVQVLKRGTLFAMRAQKLYDLYSRYETWEDVPQKEREKLESSVLKHTFTEVWDECVKFFSERDPRQVERGNANPKDKMALVFRWYLGLSSRWSNSGEKGREMDYQIWCGPAMGAFNDWVRPTYLADPANRRAADIALQILTGSAYLQRLRLLNAQGVRFSPVVDSFLPEKPLV
jgi:trans-AT polyketide synthase/acyltransferase/oxidoreductase domain-containing protein